MLEWPTNIATATTLAPQRRNYAADV